VIKNKSNFIHYLDNIKIELDKSELLSKSKERTLVDKLQEKIENQELIIPVVGAFSAGKSSLLNSFLGKNYLPTGITPETALATELRFSEKEYIEAVKKDNSIDNYEIDAIEEIKNDAYKYKYLKMYVNNKNIKDIEPLILVDMPGFESPLDLHNQAILEYLDRGVYYIVLTSVENGTITRSMVRQLEDIKEYGREFSFFLSKTNLRSPSEVREVAQNLQEQIEEYFDIEKEVLLVDDNGGKSFKKILADIDVENLFKDIFLDTLKENYNSIIETINLTISSLAKDKEKNERVIKELKNSLVKIQNERDNLIEEAYSKYSNNSVNKIVEEVGRKLTNSLDELILSATTSGQEAMSSIITEIVRHTLINNVKYSMSNISNDIIDSLTFNLKDLNSSMSNFTQTDDWLEKIADSTKTMLNSAKGGLDSIVKERSKVKTNDKMYKVITTILATTTTVLNPIIELVIIFLPDLLGGFMESYQKKKQEEQIRNNIMTQVIPSLKRELRAKLPEVFNQQVQELIKDISNRFEQVIEEKRATIEMTQKEIEEKSINIQKEIEFYNKIAQNITTLANNTLYK